MYPESVWPDFIARLQQGPLPLALFRPYPHLENLGETLQSGLNDHLRNPLLAAVKNGIQPECHPVGDQVHFILPLGSPENAVNFCFSFQVEKECWYFQHMENITIRMDQIGAPPVSVFPDLPEDQKAWARDEIEISQMVRFFNTFAAEKGKAFAFNCFKDRPAYSVGARAWIPFVEPAQAFILYACWDLANLHRNPITLLSMNETRAVIQGNLRYFALYKQAGHLAQQISFDDYYQLFETVWQDRAESAGWKLRIHLHDEEVTFLMQMQS